MVGAGGRNESLDRVPSDALDRHLTVPVGGRVLDGETCHGDEGGEAGEQEVDRRTGEQFDECTGGELAEHESDRGGARKQPDRPAALRIAAPFADDRQHHGEKAGRKDGEQGTEAERYGDTADEREREYRDGRERRREHQHRSSTTRHVRDSAPYR